MPFQISGSSFWDPLVKLLVAGAVHALPGHQRWVSDPLKESPVLEAVHTLL